MALVDAQDAGPASLDGDGQDGQEPPNNKPVSKDYANRPAPGSQRGHVPLPPPDASAHAKEPGRTRGDLTTAKPVAPSMSTASSYNASLHSVSPSEDSPPGSAPSTRPPTAPPSRVASRAPSMSGERPDSNGIHAPAPKTATATASKSAGLPHKVPAAIQKALGASAPSTPEPGTKKRPPSVKSEKEEGGFFRNALNSATPKITRRTSQRSTGGSSRKSDSDGGARSVAGDSVQSLSKKYGICERVAIGKGATSVVRLAHKWDRNDEKLYAVKEFRKRRKNETEKEYVKKLTAEFCISSTLHHINIVETVDLVQDESAKWCEVMEFCGGGDLYAAIKKGHMSPGEIECCFKQILTGVNYLHSQGVAHRDLKPENIFFNYNGHLKIGDYGASTVYRLPWEATVHMSTGLCGSEPYIAPEQFLGKPYDARLVDIWAIGIVYYCLHFQELPWRVAQPSDPLYQAYVSACANPAQTACPPTINHLSPRSCRPLIRRMLEPDPKKRALIEECLQHAWTKEIVMCYEQDKPTHIHVNADSLAKEVPQRAEREREREREP